MSYQEVLLNDQTGSGYLDIGNIRLQWGSASQTTTTNITVNLPAPFANANYSITANPAGISSAIESVSVTRSSTLAFQFLAMYAQGTTTAVNQGRVICWQAIGQKP